MKTASKRATFGLDSSRDLLQKLTWELGALTSLEIGYFAADSAGGVEEHVGLVRVRVTQHHGAAAVVDDNVEAPPVRENNWEGVGANGWHVLIEFDRVFESWKGWCDRTGEYAGSMKRFSQNIETRGYDRWSDPRSRRKGFRGIQAIRDTSNNGAQR